METTTTTPEYETGKLQPIEMIGERARMENTREEMIAAIAGESLCRLVCRYRNDQRRQGHHNRFRHCRNSPSWNMPGSFYTEDLNFSYWEYRASNAIRQSLWNGGYIQTSRDDSEQMAWIKRCKFIDSPGRSAPEGLRQGEYACMEKQL